MGQSEQVSILGRRKTVAGAVRVRRSVARTFYTTSRPVGVGNPRAAAWCLSNSIYSTGHWLRKKLCGRSVGSARQFLILVTLEPRHPSGRHPPVPSQLHGGIGSRLSKR